MPAERSQALSATRLDRADPIHLTPRARPDGQPRHLPLASGLLRRVQDQLAILRQRELGRAIGRCERCGEAIRSQQNFNRSDGVVAHVRCGVTHRSTRPSPS